MTEQEQYAFSKTIFYISVFPQLCDRQDETKSIRMLGGSSQPQVSISFKITG